MSAVIKPGTARNAQIVAPFTSDKPHPLIEAPPSDPHQEELRRLRAMLAERDAAIEAINGEIDDARTAGEAAGRAAAELEARKSREEALELLREGMEQARDALAESRERMETLALLIARTALEKLFGDDSERNGAVAALIRRRLQTVERQLLVQVEVSQSDFPDNRELAALAAEVGVAAELVSAHADLPVGACRMRLRVGALDIGFDQQWGAIRALLDELASSADLAE